MKIRNFFQKKKSVRANGNLHIAFLHTVQPTINAIVKEPACHPTFAAATQDLLDLIAILVNQIILVQLVNLAQVAIMEVVLMAN